jgi:uncharacterized protein YbaR (Trm112 family)
MIRIVCPFCHVPLSTNDLEKATLDGHACLVCPECEHILITDADSVEHDQPQAATADA